MLAQLALPVRPQIVIDEARERYEPFLEAKIKPLEHKTYKTKQTIQKPTTEPVPASGGEKAVYAFLIEHFTKAQVAGIMGNLRQEHNYQTSGDGIAQWTGSRKARLLSMSNPYSLNTQLNFMLIEMKEINLKLPNSVVGATLTFQNQFERCGMCMENQRIRYAQDIYSRY